MGAWPRPSAIARLVSFSPCVIGRVRPCAPLCSRVSRGVPRPARTSGVGPPPLPPSSPRFPAVAPCGLRSLRSLGESGRALGRVRLNAGSLSVARSQPPAPAGAVFILAPLGLASPRGSPLPSGRSRTFDARARGCPSLRPPYAQACALCPRALRLRPLSLRRQPLPAAFPTLVVSLGGGFASIPLPFAVANVFLPHTTWGFPPNPQKKEQGAAPP